MNTKIVLGILSIIPAIFGYYFYFRDMLAGKTKPHAFSWLIWSLLATNGFIVQIKAGAGVGAWVTGLTSIACLIIFAFAVFKGDTHPTKFDWSLLSLALLAMAFLFVVDNAAASLCINLFASSLGFAITIRKAYNHPHTETAISYFLNAIKFVPAILALQQYSFLTVAYPLMGMLGNATVLMVILCRRQN